MTRQETCEWREDWEGTWETACGDSSVFEEAGPEENGVRFCWYCGKRATFVHYQEETDDDE